jgi:thioredoxin-like negative regulator of GroEL
MVVHFYRGVTPRCEIVDAHFAKLAPAHVETRFVKINAEKNPFLVERLGIILMPSIVLIKDGKTDHTIHGFDEFGGVDDFSTDTVAFVLARHGVLNYEEDRCVGYICAYACMYVFYINPIYPLFIAICIHLYIYI